MIKHLLLYSLPILLLLTGCGKKVPTSPVVLSSTPTETVWEIPVEQENEIAVDAGKTEEEVIGVIVVPPSETATTVKVYEKPKTVKKKLSETITGTKGSPDYTATSDNKDVKFTTTKERGLWPWLLGLFSLLAAIYAFRKYLSRFSWFLKIFGWMR